MDDYGRKWMHIIEDKGYFSAPPPPPIINSVVAKPYLHPRIFSKVISPCAACTIHMPICSDSAWGCVQRCPHMGVLSLCYGYLHGCHTIHCHCLFNIQLHDMHMSTCCTSLACAPMFCKAL